MNENLKSFLRIFVPVMLFLAVMSITNCTERFFLAQLSEEALTGSLNGFFLARIFQSATTAVIVGGQTYVSLFHGANQPKQIGPCIWQLIWFALATALIVPPIGFFIEHLLYQNTVLAQSTGAYFSLLCWFNFLMPLGCALSSFYLGRGKPLLVVVLMISMCFLNVAIDYVCIFGWGLIPRMGIMGAALGKVISQGLLCVILGAFFLGAKNRHQFDTAKWQLEPRLFYHYLKPGFLRGVSTLPCLGDWSLVSRTMSLLSEPHMLVFTIGSTLYYVFTFIGDALFQTMMIIGAGHISKKQYTDIWPSFFNGLKVLGVASLLLGIPFFLFPDSLLLCFKGAPFFGEVPSTLQSIALWLWIALIGYGMNLLALALIIASRDAVFLFWFYCSLFLISFVPVYLTMEIFHWSSDKFWLLAFCTNMITFLIFYKRASKERWTYQEWRPTQAHSEIKE